MIPAPFLFNAWVIRVIDGDNVFCKVDRGDRDYSEWSVRIKGTNAREEDEPGGLEAEANLRELLPVGMSVVLRTVKPDKYSKRYLAAVAFMRAGVETDLATLLIAEGWAAAWDGRGAKPVPVWPRTTTKEKP